MVKTPSSSTGGNSLERHRAAVDLAVDLVVPIDQADVLGLGALLQDLGRAAQLEVLDQGDGVAVLQGCAMRVANDAGFFRYGFLGPLMPAGAALPAVGVGKNVFEGADGTGGVAHGSQL